MLLQMGFAPSCFPSLQAATTFQTRFPAGSPPLQILTPRK